MESPARRSQILDTTLAQLEAAQLVHRTDMGDPGREVTTFAFKHALVQDTAYASLLKQERKYLHRLAAKQIQQLYPQLLTENAARLAEHYWLGEEWASAADFAQRAGTNALRVYALREAMSHFDRTLEALDKLPDAAPAAVMDAILGWAQAAVRFRPYSEQTARLVRAEGLARAANDTVRLAQILYRAGSVQMASGHNLRAAPLFAECFALAEQLGDEQLTVVPTYFMGTVLVDSDPRAALDLFNRAIVLAKKHHNADALATTLGMKAMTHARMGDAAAARQEIQAALDALREVQSPMTESDVLLYAAWANLEMGDVAQGLALGQRGVDKALASENMDCLCYGFACVGFANLSSQNTTHAAELFREAIRRSRFSGAEQVENLAQSGLAMAKFFGGDAAGLSELEDAFRAAQAIGNQFGGAVAALTLGEIYLSRGDRANAQTMLDHAYDYFECTGLQPYRERVARSRTLVLEIQPQ